MPARATDPRFRWALVAVVAGATVMGIGYLLDVPAATATWPYPVTRITFAFLAAVAIAFAAPVAWVAWTEDIAAIAGVGLTIAVAFGLFAVVLLTLVPGDARLAATLALALVVAGVGAVGFLAGMRRASIDPRVTPPITRAVFVGLAAILILSGCAMLLRVPDVLPWRVDLDTQQLIGALFVGDAAYFLYAAARPAWSNAAGAWLAFLAYDVVLAIPLLSHLRVVAPEHLLGLQLYLAVVFGTLVLSAYQLLVDPRTRIIGGRVR